VKQVKGCIIDGCVANIKEIKYRADDNYCSKCGNPLVAVCKKCRSVLPNDYERAYCIRCEAEREDKKDNAKDGAKKAAGAVASLGVAAVGIAKGIIKK